MKERLDIVLVERGLAASRQTAQALIMSGVVTVEGRRQDKPGSRVDPGSEIVVATPDISYVGRGGIKLAGALDRFGIDVAGLTALDIGASTGGFTDCLLQRGAVRVLAIDVGHGQLDWKLRNDPRVVVIEKLNARYLSPADLPGLESGAGIATIDVSFISLRLVLPKLPPLLSAANAGIVALVKPQFEAGRGRVGRGGIVKDPETRREAVAGIAGYCLSIGLSVRALMRSPISGAEGNVEYFVHLGTMAGGLTPQEIESETTRLIREEPAHA